MQGRGTEAEELGFEAGSVWLQSTTYKVRVRTLALSHSFQAEMNTSKITGRDMGRVVRQREIRTRTVVAKRKENTGNSSCAAYKS